VQELGLACGALNDHRDLEIIRLLEVADFELALADDAEGRRLDPADADDGVAELLAQVVRGDTGERQIVDLVGLAARDGRLVEVFVLGIVLELGEGGLEGRRILRGEHGALDAAPEAEEKQR